jgi:nifR3 family TIM-barrel protein
LKAVRLGSLLLAHPFILAPMAGITDSAFRRLMRRHGAAMVVSELVSVNGLEYGGKKSLDLLRFNEEERPIALQLFGEDADRIVSGCQLVERLGAEVVDLNLACPVPKVVKRGAGAAMCRNLPALAITLAKAVSSVKIPVSIKIRLGWDADSRNALEVVRVAADAGVAWVAIHGRTRAQGYSGCADWDMIGDVKAKSSIPIIGNGDIVTGQIALERMKTYGVDAVMIGRGALRDPFIFETAKSLWESGEVIKQASDRYLRLLDEHRLTLQEQYANAHSAMIHARKFIAWYSSGFRGSHEFRRKVFETKESDEVWALARSFFSEVGARVGDANGGDFLMGGHG